VAPVRTDVSKEGIASIIRVTNPRVRDNVSNYQQPKHAAKKYYVYTNCVLQWLFTAYVVPTSLILVTLIVDSIRPSKTSVVKRVTGRNIQGDGFLRSEP
jgi:hypothetical protein